MVKSNSKKICWGTIKKIIILGWLAGWLAGWPAGRPEIWIFTFVSKMLRKGPWGPPIFPSIFLISPYFTYLRRIF